ncbi:diguanylate cyclase domain-containing protein [Vibrio metschnikovii]
MQLTLSVGICEYRSGDNLNELIKLADMELYKAKKWPKSSLYLSIISQQRLY